MGQLITRHAQEGAWYRRVASSRNSLVPGTYKPSATTTGVESLNLPSYNSPSTQTLIITTDGLTLQNLVIYGDIKIQARDVVIKQCYLRGGDHIPGGNSGVVDCNSSKCFNALIEDCTIRPQRANYYRDGIVGHEYTARRNDIGYTNDGLGAFVLSSLSPNANVTAEANYIHDLTYWYPEPAHTDGTHNDCMQIQGGANIVVIGNYFLGTSVLGAGSDPNPDKPRLLGETPKMINGSGIIIQKQSITSPLANVVVRQNWFNGGLAGVNMKPGSYEVSDNRFGRDFYDYNKTNGFTQSEYPIRGDDSTSTTVAGLYDSNRWEDTNVLMAGAINGGTRFDGIRWNDIAD